MFSNLKLFILLLVISLLRTITAGEQPLRFIGAVHIPNEAEMDGVPIGGLSSIGFDAKTGELFSVCDDTGLKGGPRVHHFTLELSPAGISIEPSRVTFLRNPDGSMMPPERIVDAEGLDILPNGQYIVASEGIDVRGYFELPALLIFDQEGKYQADWPIPAKFLPKGKKMVDFGVRANDAFESLTLSPDGRTLFMANEKALLQDGPIPGLGTESPIRVIKHQRDADMYKATAEYIYHISPLAMLNNDPETIGFRSVSDMMALDNNRLMVIEKTFFTKPVSKNSVQLFIAELTEQSTDVSKFDSVLNIDYQPLYKKLWIDLDQFEGSEGFPNLDNIEGITLGPRLDNGNNTLILVTDNNFSPRQRNLFYAFEIISMN